MPVRARLSGVAVSRAFAAVVALSLALAVGASATPAASHESAGSFMTRILREELNGQWGQQWAELHPGHKKLISRAQYIACSRELATNIGTGRETYRVLATADDAIDIFGVPQHAAKLVTIRFHTPGNSTTPTYRLHAVPVGGHWTWVLGGRFLRAVQRGQCMDGSPLIRPGQ
jgi:hypothetical protein